MSTLHDYYYDERIMTMTQPVTVASNDEAPKRAVGIDISKYQGVYKPQAHHDFVILRATVGAGADPLYEENLFNIGDNAIGAYHYFLSNIDWREQADNLMTTAHDADFFALDFEKIYNEPSAYFAEDARHFVEFVRDDTGKQVLFYSNPSTIQEWMFQYNVCWVRDYANLWVAQWPYHGWNDILATIPDDWTWQPRLPAGCEKWRFWQYSGDGNRRGSFEGVESYDCDLDVFNGTVDDLHAWIGGVLPNPVTDRNEIIDECIDALERLKD
jgi:lysozyme